MKQKIFLGGLITSIFLTLFSVNVSASEDETTSSSSLVEETQETVTTPYSNYVIIKYGSNYYVIVNAEIDENGNIKVSLDETITPNEITFLASGNSYSANLDTCVDKLKNGSITTGNNKSLRYLMGEIISSSHDIITNNGDLVFRQSPLKTSSQVVLTVGKMTPQQIVQATMKQKVYLLPFLIVSVVGFLAFRKGLAMLFRTLGKA